MPVMKINNFSALEFSLKKIKGIEVYFHSFT